MAPLISAICFIVLLSTLYRWIFACAYFLRGRQPEAVAEDPIPVRILVLIPAHDEESVLSDCLSAVSTAVRKVGSGSVWVIADNCRDKTADIARRAGANVLERTDPTRTGKGHALQWAIPRLPLSDHYAIAIIDADSLMAEDFLAAASAHLRNGHRIIQGYDGVANPNDSALTELISITNSLKNLLYNHGKSILGLSPHLMGTGMVIHSDVLLRKGWSACSIVESIEQSILFVSSGERVVFAPEAKVFAQEARSLRQAIPQRQRWASGQIGLVFKAARLLLRGIVERNVILVDSAIDLLLPVRYSMTANLALAAVGLSLANSGPGHALTGLSLTLLMAQLIEFAAGAHICQRGPRVILAASIAPVFLLMKAAINLMATVGFRRFDWRRTERHDRLLGARSSTVGDS